ncbi:MAG: nicotinate-nucleotide adenylyltransferase [Terriglobia bacterium]
MNVAIFGGTFDPVHSGHMQAAKAAARRYGLDRVLFVPSGNPPHKGQDRLTPFHHRYAMVALACSMDARFVASLLEAPNASGRPHYSIDTARRLKHTLKSHDRCYFLLGADAFADLPHWKDYRKLLDTVNIIVVSRPGFSTDDIWKTVPREAVISVGRGKSPERFEMRQTALHILRGVHAPVAARDIRDAIRAGRRVTGLVPSLVEQYILKEGLYRPAPAGPKR